MSIVTLTPARRLDRLMMNMSNKVKAYCHTGYGDLLDGGQEIQHDTLSRWRSGVQIPPGSPDNSRNPIHIGQKSEKNRA
jgi:hypothetical protein